MMAPAELESCALPDPPAAWPAREWRVGTLTGTLRLPPGYEFDTAGLSATAEQAWRLPKVGRVELGGLDAMEGLAVGGGRPVPDRRPCATELLGHRAGVGFLTVVTPQNDTAYFAFTNTIVRTGAGFQAVLAARDRGALRDQLAALRSVTLAGSPGR